MRNSPVACLIGAVISTFAWLAFFASHDVTGSQLIEGIAIAIVGGVVAGWAVALSFRRNRPQTGPIVVAALVLFCPMLIYWFAGNSKPATQERNAVTTHSTGRPAEKPSLAFGRGVVEEPDLKRSFNDTRIEGVKDGIGQGIPIGKAQAYDPPQEFGRRGTDIKPVQIGTGKWRWRFQAPGPAMIKTGLSMNLGDTYYIKMNQEARTLQFGWLEMMSNGKEDFGPMPAPPSALVCEDPFRYQRQSVPQGSNPQLVFWVSTIPSGRYEITISKSPFEVKPDEYAPGIPLQNRW